MWPYWLLFLLPSFAALISRDDSGGGWRPVQIAPPGPGWAFVWLVLVVMIGFRFRVGGDWHSYVALMEMTKHVSLQSALTLSDPGYALLNWLSANAGFGIYGVNVTCAVIFATALIVFCRTLPRPWLAFAVAIPYLVLVLGMGYSRQGVALGFVLLAFVGLQRASTAWYVIWVVLGATFHKTALLMLPVVALANSKNRYGSVLWVLVIGIAAYYFLISDSVDRLVKGYVEGQVASEGALIRLVMSAIPATLLLWKWDRFGLAGEVATLWRGMAVLSLVLIPVLFLSPSSTVVDRLALYLLPLQLVVFSALPNVLGKRGGRNQVWVSLVLVFYALVLLVWLTFANNSAAWVPYRNFIFEDLV